MTTLSRSLLGLGPCPVLYFQDEAEALAVSDLVEPRFLGLIRKALEVETITKASAAEMLDIGHDEMRKRAMEWRDGV